MQDLEMPDYVNDGARRGDTLPADQEKPERRLFSLLFLIVGLLCVVQVLLNVSLRVAYNSSKTSACNSTQVGGRATAAPSQMVNCPETSNQRCNQLQERFNALTADKNLLENRNNVLVNKIKTLEEDIQRLQINISELSRCASSRRCPAGWLEINSRCYFLSTVGKPWEEGRRDCQSRNGDLVVIDSEQEQRAIYRLNGDVDLLFWIGLRGSNGNFIWVDGSELTDRWWQAGQPDHGGENKVEDCVEMYHRNPPLSSWNDAPCGGRRRWMCEREPCGLNVAC